MPVKQTITPAKLREWGACYDDDKIDELWVTLFGGRRSITMRELFACEHVPMHDRMWVAEHLMTRRHKALMAAWCIERFMRDHREATPRRCRQQCRDAIKLLRAYGRGEVHGWRPLLVAAADIGTRHAHYDARDVANEGLSGDYGLYYVVDALDRAVPKVSRQHPSTAQREYRDVYVARLIKHFGAYPLR